MITTGIANFKGAIPHAIAIDNAPKDTCDRPSPIIEYLFRTKLTPRSAAHNETNIPPKKAL